MTTRSFSFKKFLLGLLTGIATIAIVVITSVFLWGDKFLTLINNLYLKF